MSKLWLVGVIVIVLLIGYFYLIRASKSPVIAPSPIPRPVELPVLPVESQDAPTPAPSQGVFYLPAQSSKRQFVDDSDSLFAKQNFYAVPMSIPESDLVGMRCSPFFQGGQDLAFQYVNQKTNKTLLLEPKFVGIISAINKISNDPISATDYCQTDDIRALLDYEIWGGGGGSQDTAYFNTVNSDLSVTPLTKITNDGPAYFECPIFLELTNKNILYVQCGGGDGGGGGQSIYAIDLNTKTKTLIKKCVSGPDSQTCNP